jgi:hypothetical protein
MGFGIVVGLSNYCIGDVAKHQNLVQFSSERVDHIFRKSRRQESAQIVLVSPRPARWHLCCSLIPKRKSQGRVACFPGQTVIALTIEFYLVDHVNCRSFCGSEGYRAEHRIFKLRCSEKCKPPDARKHSLAPLFETHQHLSPSVFRNAFSLRSEP